MIMIELMSLRLGIHHLHETIKQVVGIVGAGTGFGVVLDREGAVRGGADAFVCAIEQGNVRCLNVAGQAFQLNREAMVLRGDFDLARLQVFNRVVPAAVALMQLRGLGAQGLRKDLMTQTNAKDGCSAF